MRKLLGILVGLLLVLALASCGSSESESDAAGEETAETEEAAESGDTESDGESDEAEEADSDETATEGDGDGEAVSSDGPTGSFSYAIEIPFPSWDPHSDGRNAVMSIFDITYDGLVNMAPDGEIVPALASEWVIDGNEIAFTLREGSTFHDGTPVDADAVVYNIEKAQGTPGPSGNALRSITEVRVESPTEVVIVMEELDRALLTSLSLMPGRMMSPNVTPEDVAAGVPAGSGPYMIQDFTGDVVTLVPHEGYWDSSTQGFETITISSLPDPAARINSLLTGEVDAITVTSNQIPEVEGAGFAVTEGVLANVMSFVINDIEGVDLPELGDIRVRQALAHAIDPAAWDAAIIQGNGGTPVSQLFQEGSEFHVEDFEGFEYDPERSRELLAEAGVTDLVIPSATWGPFLPGTQVLQQFFADVGVTLELTQTEPGGDIAAKREGTSFAGLAPSGDAHPQSAYVRYFAPGSVNNIRNGTVDGLEEARAAAAAAPDDAAAAVEYQNMLRIAYENAWLIPLNTNNSTVAYDAEAYPNLSGMDRRVLTINLRELSPAG